MLVVKETWASDFFLETADVDVSLVHSPFLELEGTAQIMFIRQSRP